MLVVADAGPLIYLSVLQKLELLAELHGRVVVPGAVWREVVEVGAGLPGSAEVAAATWIEVRQIDESAALVVALREHLDLGEASAIGFGVAEGADLLLIDERRGRHAATRLGLKGRGTLGVLVQAKRAGLIDAVGPHLQRLASSGFRLTDALTAAVLRQVGEAS